MGYACLDEGEAGKGGSAGGEEDELGGLGRCVYSLTRDGSAGGEEVFEEVGREGDGKAGWACAGRAVTLEHQPALRVTVPAVVDDGGATGESQESSEVPDGGGERQDPNVARPTLLYTLPVPPSSSLPLPRLSPPIILPPSSLGRSPDRVLHSLQFSLRLQRGESGEAGGGLEAERAGRQERYGGG